MIRGKPGGVSDRSWLAMRWSWQSGPSSTLRWQYRGAVRGWRLDRRALGIKALSGPVEDQESLGSLCACSPMTALAQIEGPKHHARVALVNKSPGVVARSSRRLGKSNLPSAWSSRGSGAPRHPPRRRPQAAKRRTAVPVRGEVGRNRRNTASASTRGQPELLIISGGGTS